MAIHQIKSDRTIQTLKRGVKRLNDGDGLYLLPFAKGLTHYWRFDYTFEGRRNTQSMGVYPDVGLALARQKAQEVREALARGEDPSARRKTNKQKIAAVNEALKRIASGQPAVGSFEEVARRWFACKQKDWVVGYSDKVIRRLEIHAFPIFGHVQIENISTALVLSACRKVQEAGTIETAHRVAELCSLVFRFAIAEGHTFRDPCVDMRGALKNAEKKNFAAITNPDHLAQLLRTIDEYSGSYVVKSALKLMPHLMVRPGELRQAHWCEFDLLNGQWLIPGSRMKALKHEKMTMEPHWVKLSPPVVKILRDLFELTGRSGILFPGQGRKGRYMSNNTVNVALRAMGYDKTIVTGHGFRATARTLIVDQLQISGDIVEMQLAHAVKDANGNSYNRTELIPERSEMMHAWSAYLEDLRLGRPTVNRARLPKFVPVTGELAIKEATDQP